MRLNLELKKGKTTIHFISPVKVSGEIKLNKAEIKWLFYNVGINEKILTGTTENDIPTGYYSFDDLKEFLENLNCTVVLEKSGKVSVTPPSGETLNMKNVGVLLGFNKNDELTSKKLSPYIADIHGGLSRIEIFCDKVNSYRNYINGKRSEKLCQILNPGGNLFGTSSHHTFGDGLIPMERCEMNSIEFTLTDDSHLTDKDSYQLFLDCEIA